MRGDRRDQEFRNGMPFFGGSLWLDLLNTTPMDGAVPRDLIDNDAGLRAWLDGAEITSETADREALRDFRERLREAFEQLRAAQPLSPELLAGINARLRKIALRFELVEDGGALRLSERLESSEGGAEGIVAVDFARFSCDHEPERLKHCANPACTMVFYDRGKNNSRRWCSMNLCGNRDKVARYRARQAGG